jgi:formamidopyrimidine-DNA glycosylase
MHLGMSGSLRILPKDTPPQKHDHFDLVFNNKQCLRLRDPRRFGAVLWTSPPVEEHFLLKELGPEPLSKEFNAEYLYRLTRNKKTSMKNVIMNAHNVVGVGNIYASEALFYAGIKPTRIANKLTATDAEKLVKAIQDVLHKAIKAGGTTLQDFAQTDGKPGYFAQQLAVYGRAGKPCVKCNAPIRSRVIGGRNTYYCGKCQK